MSGRWRPPALIFACAYFVGLIWFLIRGLI